MLNFSLSHQLQRVLTGMSSSMVELGFERSLKWNCFWNWSHTAQGIKQSDGTYLLQASYKSWELIPLSRKRSASSKSSTTTSRGLFIVNQVCSHKSLQVQALYTTLLFLLQDWWGRDSSICRIYSQLEYGKLLRNFFFHSTKPIKQAFFTLLLVKLSTC